MGPYRRELFGPSAERIRSVTRVKADRNPAPGPVDRTFRALICRLMRSIEDDARTAEGRG